MASGGRSPAQKGCTACGETKPLEQFHRQDRGLYGRRSQCRACHNAKRLAKAALKSGHRLQRPLGSSVSEYIRFRVVEEDRGFTSPCWIWLLGLTVKGYARQRLPGTTKIVFVHRASYETKHGPVPDSLVIDHLCQQKACVNPDHLEPVTIGENLRRYWRQAEDA